MFQAAVIYLFIIFYKKKQVSESGVEDINNCNVSSNFPSPPLFILSSHILEINSSCMLSINPIRSFKIFYINIWGFRVNFFKVPRAFTNKFYLCTKVCPYQLQVLHLNNKMILLILICLWNPMHSNLYHQPPFSPRLQVSLSIWWFSVNKSEEVVVVCVDIHKDEAYGTFNMQTWKQLLPYVMVLTW